MTTATHTSSFFRTDIRSAIQYSQLSRDEKDSLLRHVQYLTPQEMEELRATLAI